MESDKPAPEEEPPPEPVLPDPLDDDPVPPPVPPRAPPDPIVARECLGAELQLLCENSGSSLEDMARQNPAEGEPKFCHDHGTGFRPLQNAASEQEGLASSQPLQLGFPDIDPCFGEYVLVISSQPRVPLFGIRGCVMTRAMTVEQP